MSKRTRTALLIAYHYPPCATSSGLQRTLSFSMHLEQYGWRAIVLTADPRAYERTSTEQLRDIPASVTVVRARALDAARHLSMRGRYFSGLAVPDRWVSWWLFAVPLGVRLIRRHGVSLIWSTYPIATAHRIGSTLARLTGVPWVADFRDPMVEFLPDMKKVFPEDARIRRARLKVEASTVCRARRLVFCTEGARRIAMERYPQIELQRVAVIPNGYAEQAFRDAERLQAPTKADRRLLLHSGTIYPGPDRDPTALFRAVKSLSEKGYISARNFELRLRAPSHDDHFRRLAQETGVDEIVSILPPLPYREALAEMLTADGLLLLQGYPSNPAVPAKLYEYLRARRPILGLVHPDGETAATLQRMNIPSVAPLEDPDSIERLVLEWLEHGEKLEKQLPTNEMIARFSREGLTETLAEVFDAAIATKD